MRAAEELLDTYYFETFSTGDNFSARDEDARREIAAAMRRSWERYGRTTGPDRWFAILADDEAGPDRWLPAVFALLPEAVWNRQAGRRVIPDGPMPGDVLRSRRDPSVSDLIEQRVPQVATADASRQVDPRLGARALLQVVGQ